MFKKIKMIQGLLFAVEFLTNLFKAVTERGGNEETIYNALKSNSKLIEKFAELIVGVSKTFFTEAKNFFFGSNFKNWILSSITDSIPVYNGKHQKYTLPKSMNDTEIQNATGNKKPFTIPEFFGLIHSLIVKQLNGEDGELLNNGYANIFHVELSDGTVVAVYVSWDSDDREWGFGASEFDFDRWLGGTCAFVRS